MPRFFIDRPIFAWVFAIVIMLVGMGCITMLPVAQYPDVAPTQVNINATYPGASAQTIQNSVTQIIEQQLTGIDGMLYFGSTSTSQGTVTISAVFAKGTNPDVAQMQVQNAVTAGMSQLPNEVQQQGVTVTKSNPDLLLVVALYDETDRMTNFDVADWLTSNLQDPLGRVPGVGQVGVFGGAYAMRIWLDPNKLRSYSLMPSDVVNAIAAQNLQVAAGEVGGQPEPTTQRLDAVVTAQSMMQTPEQFRNIVVRSDASGARVLVGDVARVELGADNYNIIARANGHPGAGISISLAPGADALSTANLVKTLVAQSARNFPSGVRYAYANDTTGFIKLSVTDVVKTLFEAMVLVIIVMFVFLQSWRTTLIPAIAIPVVLLGTFGILYMLGFSINTMTLFGLVLAIGLLVDDAIVVVENVERLLEENPDLPPREATIRSMGQIQMALVAIAMALSAVFLPMVFFGGSTGVIYRQFSATIVSAMLLSAFVALTLSPALAATLLKRKAAPTEGGGGLAGRFPGVGRVLAGARDRFNRGFSRTTDLYVRSVHHAIDRKALFFGLYAVIVALLVILYARVPTGFLPTEDQGTVSVQWRLPPGASLGQTIEVQQAIENYFLNGPESRNIATYFTVAGGGQGAAGQNTGQAFINLAPFSHRTRAQDSAAAIVQRATAAFRNFRNAQVFTLVPGAIRGLGQSAGFTMELRNTSAMTQTQFAAARDRLLAMAQADPALAQVRLSQLADNASLGVDVDQGRLAALGLNANDVNTTLSTAWGGDYVNDFIDRGRIKRVLVQGDAPYRAEPSDIDQWSVRNNLLDMVPFNAFARTSWSLAPVTLSRFNGVPSYEYQGTAAPGTSSGQAMARIAQLASEIPGVGVAWAGQSYQERLSSGQALLLYGISLIVVFLCLAALYESWSVPFAVLLIVPLGLVGAIFAVTLRGLQNDVYLQIGLLTTMGLAAKNAILVVEFAERAEKEAGKSVIDAALEAARIRLRPILMTSFAVIFGVLPLAIASGPGANSRIEIGTAVIGGMLTATILAVFYIPLSFVLVRSGLRDGLKAIRARLGRRQEARA